jgi:1-acyl-sn-glycerol-3-phosphate acyltransferase
VARRYLQRVVTIPIVAVTFALSLALPLLLVLTLACDIATNRRLRFSRLALFVVWLGWIEVLAVCRALQEWFRAAGRMRRPSTQQRLQRLVGQHGHRIVIATSRTLGLRLVVTGLDCVDDRAAVLCLSHHTSLFDSVLPAELLGYQRGYDVHYVMKRSLEWSPAFNIVGRWIPVHFVDRSGRDTAAELVGIAGLARGLKPGQAPVIYPEGTFFSERRLARAVEQLAEHSPDLASRASSFRYVLPPKSGGASALLDAAPEIDVLLAVHVGFERFTSLGRIVTSVPFREPIHVHFWRVPRSEVPTEPDARFRWLFEQFETMDRWVHERMSEVA